MSAAVDIESLILRGDGLATTSQLLTAVSRKQLAGLVKSGMLIRVCHGVYAPNVPDVSNALDAAQLRVGRPVVACMGTAAALYGFDTERTTRIHVLDPGIRMRPSPKIMVHQRIRAPLRRVKGHLATTPAWTAIEVARALRPARALATLDAALRVGACTAAELDAAAREQHGRRGIVKVRELLAYADGRAESPMESEARLLFIGSGLPMPELQYSITDRHGRRWRADFAWPASMVLAEYDSVEWHLDREALLHDRLKLARLQECGWTTVPMTVDDIRHDPVGLIARINGHLAAPRVAG
ncbi:type IV toxin-antitoxin system AbiEi family antitoxin domain-containing protein [Mycobacterium avium]|uniref:type IV toxin-antitoxin system AbiEi family antitoxin domain-containing protein n=1 Tax=Mycobacterium avium TaxID=1764 RepID=UPI001D153F83|nr:type IV toxin-antitoxin system AbiEi family antitoxin domain-containing protein [Mycobacterium avium]MDV3264662.1 type IV toxin-antitoxin system AbiEi family antitoxin domain-containing protein [Mycobacterium avium]UEA21278.1 type IV toxin-antitoxin system AbiEi family antitoxin domain-containing protein [Mycobacterium avium subsp. avium]UEA32418.1 type IV toxin-antitoxin system AbiEi family antitoxin domain-containing protein [Mycobacterium avium subsp. avium]UGU10306.1 type IV toxin-antito